MPAKIEITNEVQKNDDIVRVSNQWIRGKSKRTSLNENKILDIAFAKVTEESGSLVARITTREIKNYLGLKGNSIYGELDSISEEQLKHTIIIKNNPKLGSGNFIKFNVVEECSFVNGIFTIRFNNKMKPYIMDIQNDYTNINIKLTCSFRSSFTYHLYKELRSYYYGAATTDGDGVVRVPFSNNKVYTVAELKFICRVADPDYSTKVSQLIKEGLYDEAIEEIGDVPFADWKNFKRKVLNVAKKELDESPLSDIIFDYEVHKGGRGGKVQGITFYVKKNPEYKGSRRFTFYTCNGIEIEDSRDVMIQKTKEIIDEPILDEQAIDIYKAAGGDVDLIRRSYELAKKSPYIDNFVGWMVQCVKEDWADNEEISLMADRTQEEIAELDQLYQEYLEERQYQQ